MSMTKTEIPAEPKFNEWTIGIAYNHKRLQTWLIQDGIQPSTDHFVWATVVTKQEASDYKAALEIAQTRYSKGEPSLQTKAA